jgi:hypothetical protein
MTVVARAMLCSTLRMSMRSVFRSVAVATLAALLTAPAAAQQPPTAPDPKTPPPPADGKRREGDAIPQPPLPPRLKKLQVRAQNHPLVQHLLNGDDGWYPRGFSIWTGAGVSAGLGYRRHVLDGAVLADVSGELSVRGYRLVESSLELQTLPRPFYVRADARYRHFPQEDFFGVGGNSREPLRSTYLLKTGEIWGTFGGRTETMTAGLESGVLAVGVGAGTDDRYPTVQQLFAESAAPGLTDQPTYLRTGLFWTLSRLDDEGYPRRGTKYRVTFNDYRDLTLGQFSFKRFDGEATAYVPVVANRDVVAIRGRVVYTNNAPGHIVPFYMLPTLGGGSSLRAFDEFRYRDENALLLNLEYRIGVHKYADLALFADAGKVAHDYQDIDFKGLIADYGAGLRFHTATRTLFRLDIARGREGMRYLFKMTRAF